MALKLVNSKSYTMRPASFVWGFDPDAEGVLSPRSVEPQGRKLSAVEHLSRMLLAGIARAGWDVDGLETVVTTYNGERRGLMRYVSHVSGSHRGLTFDMDFSANLSDGFEYVPGRFNRFSLGNVNFPSELRNWSEEQFDLFEDVVMTATSSVGTAPSSPGAADITIEGDANIRRLFHQAPVPAPPGFPALYCWVRTDDLSRRPDDVVLSSTGLILVSDCGPDDFPFLPERRYDSFDYASTDISVKADQGVFRVPDKAVPVEVKLRYLNEIYVMDMAMMDDARGRVDQAIQSSGRQQATAEEVYEIGTAAAKTMIPASKYEGGFRRPVYAIGRHLRSDEARFMKGQVRAFYEGNNLEVSMVDAESGNKMVFISGRGSLDSMLHDATTIAYHVGCELEVDDSVHEEIAARRARSEARYAASSPMGP